MSILSELTIIMNDLDISMATGVFKGKAPDEYVVITPLADTFEAHADNRPGIEVQEARLSLFSKNNYQQRKNQITRALLDSDFTVTARRYVGHEDDTGYHHYALDVAQHYKIQED